AYIHSSSEGNDYAVGLIYTKKIMGQSNNSEKEFIGTLYKTISGQLSYKIVLYIGQTVDDISMIAESYKSAMIAKSFQLFADKYDIVYYDEIKGSLNTETYLMDKDIMDHLIRAIEENDKVEIDRNIGVIYQYFKDQVARPE